MGQAEAQFQEAARLYRAGDYDAALQILDQLRANYPSSLSLMEAKARCVQALGASSRASASQPAQLAQAGRTEQTPQGLEEKTRGRQCIECGRKRGLLAYNYAGFDVSRAANSHPKDKEWIKSIVLPGDRERDFLCVRCANTRQVSCGRHGRVEGKLSRGTRPICKVCVKRYEVILKGRQWQYWGKLQKLPCPFCGKKTERARLQGFGFGGAMALAGRPVSSEGGEHIPQECENCGETFVSMLAPIREGGNFHYWRYK